MQSVFFYFRNNFFQCIETERNSEHLRQTKVGERTRSQGCNSRCIAEGGGGCTWRSGEGTGKRGDKNERRNILISAKAAWCILGGQKLHRKPRPGENRSRILRDDSPANESAREHVYPQRRRNAGEVCDDDRAFTRVLQRPTASGVDGNEHENTGNRERRAKRKT